MYTEINNTLKNRYENYIYEVKKAVENQDSFSAPLLMNVFPAYSDERINHKILFVGKETFGWAGKSNNSDHMKVDYLMKHYADFDMAKSYKGKNSPFWRFNRKIFSNLNPEANNNPELRNGFLWSNIFKIDENKKTPNMIFRDQNIHLWRILQDEIHLTKPNIIIFSTGHGLDSTLKKIFPDIRFKEQLYDNDLLVRCESSNLPYNSFRTSHPKYLSIKRKFDDVCRIITEKILENEYRK